MKFLYQKTLTYFSGGDEELFAQLSILASRIPHFSRDIEGLITA
jgi:hypothetical protein